MNMVVVKKHIEINVHFKHRDPRDILFQNMPFLKDSFIYLKFFFEAKFSIYL